MAMTDIKKGETYRHKDGHIVRVENVDDNTIRWSHVSGPLVGDKRGETDRKDFETSYRREEAA